MLGSVGCGFKSSARLPMGRGAWIGISSETGGPCSQGRSSAWASPAPRRPARPRPPARSLAPSWVRGTFHLFRGRPWPEPQPAKAERGRGRGGGDAGTRVKGAGRGTRQ